MNWQYLGLILGPLIPMVGNLLLRIPVVPNKIIPAILVVFNTAAKYWGLAGLPTEVAPAPVIEGAGLFGELGRFGLSLVWGVAEVGLSRAYYEAKKALKKPSWVTAGSRDVWQR